MHYFKLAAMGILALGLSANAAIGKFGQWNAGVAAQGSELHDNDAYRPGAGVAGFTGMERPMMGSAALAGLGLRANYANYQIEGDEAGKDLNEGGVAVTGMVGPNTVYFQPRLGGHVGYTRLEDNNFLDLGADLSAAYKITPAIGIQAMVTPTWYVNDNNADYVTKLGVGVVWSAPGA